MSELQQAPGVARGSVELVTRKLRVVTKSTSETRGLGEAVAKAYREAKGRQKASGAFQPSNTLKQGSRPAPFRGIGGGKRGKWLAAAAAQRGGGGGGGGGAGGGMDRGAVSSGRVRRRQDSDDEVEEVEEPGGRRSDGHEQVCVGGGAAGERESVVWVRVPVSSSARVYGTGIVDWRETSVLSGYPGCGTPLSLALTACWDSGFLRKYSVMSRTACVRFVYRLKVLVA